MALVVYDRIQQTGTANTTVSFTLSATTTGYQSFAVVGNGNTTYYSANDGTNWEVGLGTYSTTGPTLTRTTILSSSNSGSAVTFTGTVTVFCDYPAGKGVYQDANGNVSNNTFVDAYSNTAAAGTTTTLTASSIYNYVVTGSGGQTFKLPDATTLLSGAIYTFNNNQSSGTIVVQNNSSTTIATIQSGAFVELTLLSNAIAAGSWDTHYEAPSNVSWSTNSLDYAGSITSATWNGNTVAYNRGGTGQSSAFTAGGIVYGSTTSALAVTPIGTTGQVLTSAGAGTPTWTTPTTGTVTSVTGTSPVVSSGGNTPAISMPAATSSVNGYLTSADWTTFNNKGSGTVTSVSGTGTVSGISLSGAVTSTGNLTLGGTLDLSSPPAIGGTSPNSVKGTVIQATNGIVVNSNTVSASYSIPSGSNAMSAGPMTVASGQTVTVPSGSRWVVL